MSQRRDSCGGAEAETSAMPCPQPMPRGASLHSVASTPRHPASLLASAEKMPFQTTREPPDRRLARGQKLLGSVRNLLGGSSTSAALKEQAKREERAKRKKSLTAADSEEDKVGTKEAPGRSISESAQARRSRLEASRASGKARASEGAGPSSEADEQSVLEGMLRLGVPREVAEAALAQRVAPDTQPAARSPPPSAAASATVLDC